MMRDQITILSVSPILLTVALFSLMGCQTRDDETNSVSIALQSSPDTLELFGENVVSTALYERDIAITPQGDELIYSLGDYKQNQRCLVVLNLENGNWSQPEILNISGKYQDIEPFYSHNGNRLYFASNRPIYNDETRSDYNIWYSDRVGDVWTEPIALDSVINTRGDEFYPSLSNNGNLYFTATRADGVGREDIFIAEFIDEQFKYPKPLPENINTAKYEFNAYISPKEDLIIFSSYGREDDLGGGDLYISYKDTTGNWTASQNMGELINSNKLDYCPFIDWNARNFYFTSDRAMKNPEDLKNINTLRLLANSALNGFGNIYRIGLDQIGKL